MPAPVDLEDLLSRALAALAERPALSAADMKPLKKHMGVLGERFIARGFEVTTKTVRAPLERQLVDLVAQGPTPFKGIEKRVQGATGAEVKVALAALVRDGAVVEALRPAGRYLLAPQGRAATLTQDEQRVVLASLATATKLLRAAQGKKKERPVVFREDVFAALERWMGQQGSELPSVSASSAPPRLATSRDAPDILLRVAEQVRVAGRPVRVPELLRALGMATSEGGQVLLEGARRGLFALEPESGMARLSPEDAALCPAGPFGTQLSWVVPVAAPGGRT